MDPSHVALLVEPLVARGWAVLDDWLPQAHWRRLSDVCGDHHAAGRLHPAAIGRGPARQHDAAVRGDRTRWLQDGDPADELALGPLRALRAALARELRLPLAAEEAHYAVYPPGARYARHRDRFRDDDARLLSAVCYLNADWSDADGGALRLYPEDGAPACDIAPRGGRLVVLRAERIEHEVLPARRERRSIAAWLRRDDRR